MPVQACVHATKQLSISTCLSFSTFFLIIVIKIRMWADNTQPSWRQTHLKLYFYLKNNMFAGVSS